MPGSVKFPLQTPARKNWLFKLQNRSPAPGSRLFTLARPVPHRPHFSATTASVGVTGLEPVTLRLSSACSNQLSYTPRFGEFGRCGDFVIFNSQFSFFNLPHGEPG